MHLLLNALVDCGDILARHRTANNFIDELEAFSTLIFCGLKAHPHMTVLPAPPRLAHKLTLDLGSIENALSVGHLWLANIGLNTEFATHSVHDNIEVEFTHT